MKCMKLATEIKALEMKLAADKLLVQNENAIWFQTKDNLFAQVMRVGDGKGNEKYHYEVYDIHTYPRWYAHPKNGKLVLDGFSSSLSLAKNEVLKFFDQA